MHFHTLHTLYDTLSYIFIHLIHFPVHFTIHFHTLLYTFIHLTIHFHTLRTPSNTFYDTIHTLHALYDKLSCTFIHFIHFPIHFTIHFHTLLYTFIQLTINFHTFYEFSSVAESKRHVSVLHRYYKKTLPSNEKKKQYVCKVKSCCRVFASYHQLNTHKKKENHFVRKQADGKKEASVARKKKDGMKVKEKIQKFSTQQERMIRW